MDNVISRISEHRTMKIYVIGEITKFKLPYITEEAGLVFSEFKTEKLDVGVYYLIQSRCL